MPTHIGIFIDGIEMPVNPSEVKLKLETDDHQQVICSLGEINQIGVPKLMSIQIQSVFPQNPRESHYTTAQNFLPTATNYINKLKHIQTKKRKVRVVITGTEITYLMTVQSFEYGFADGYDQEYAYTLVMKEFRFYAAKKLKIPKSKRKVGKKGKKRPKRRKKGKKGKKKKPKKKRGRR